MYGEKDMMLVAAKNARALLQKFDAVVLDGYDRDADLALRRQRHAWFQGALQFRLPLPRELFAIADTKAHAEVFCGDYEKACSAYQKKLLRALRVLKNQGAHTLSHTATALACRYWIRRGLEDWVSELSAAAAKRRSALQKRGPQALSGPIASVLSAYLLLPPWNDFERLVFHIVACAEDGRVPEALLHAGEDSRCCAP